MCQKLFQEADLGSRCGGGEDQTGGTSEANALRGKYYQYFEDLVFASNADIRPNDLFETVSNGGRRMD